MSFGVSLCVTESLIHQFLLCVILAKLIPLCLGFFIYKMGMKTTASSTGFPASSNGNYLSSCKRWKPWCHSWLRHALPTFSPMALWFIWPPPWSLHRHPQPILLQQSPNRSPSLPCPHLYHLVSTHSLLNSRSDLVIILLKIPPISLTGKAKVLLEASCKTLPIDTCMVGSSFYASSPPALCLFPPL